MPEYIERESLIKSLTYEYLKPDCQLAIGFNAGIERAKLYVVGTVADDVEPVKHGRWIQDYVTDADPHQRIRYKCSLCGRYEEYREPYCNCGAKMDMKL